MSINSWFNCIPFRRKGKEKAETRKENTFPMFPTLPAEIRIEIWGHYMEAYKDNAAVVWRVVWGIDNSEERDGRPKQEHLRIRPYIDFDFHTPSSIYLVEVDCCPLLKVNHEARDVALRGHRYASIPVLGRDINVIVRPSLDFIIPEENTLFRLVRDWKSRYDPPMSIKLTDDMSFARNVIMSARSFKKRYCRQGNYTLSAIPPPHYSEPRFDFSLATIAQTYLRNAKDIYVEPPDDTDSTPGIALSGRYYIPMRYRLSSTVSFIINMGRFCRQTIRNDPSRAYRRNPAIWHMMKLLSQPRPLIELRSQRLGQFSHSGDFTPDIGPRVHFVNCGRIPSTPADVEALPIFDRLNHSSLSRTRSRYVVPRRTSNTVPESPPETPRNRAPSTLPLRQATQGRLLQILAVAEGNFFRERHCYSPILPSSAEFKDGCPRCYKKIWLTTGVKPVKRVICKGEECWTSYYRVTAQRPESVQEGYTSDDDEKVVEFERMEGVRTWCQMLDGYIDDDDDLVNRLVANDVMVDTHELCTWTGVRPGWVNRPRPRPQSAGQDEEERLLFWDDLIEKEPEEDDEAIEERERRIRRRFSRRFLGL